MKIYENKSVKCQLMESYSLNRNTLAHLIIQLKSLENFSNSVSTLKCIKI